MSRLICQQLIDSIPHKEVTLDKGTIIANHHQKVEYLYVLQKGSLNHYLSLDHPKKDILVGKTKFEGSVIGWSGFNTPGRFSCKIKVASKEARLLRFNFSDVFQLVFQEKRVEWLKNLGALVYQQLESSLNRQLSKGIAHPHINSNQLESFLTSPEPHQDEVINLMRRSPFMEAFQEKYLREVSLIVERRDYLSGEIIFEQNTDTEGLYILIQGEVAIDRVEDERSVSLRSISTPGFIFGWSSYLDTHDACTTLTTVDTSVYFIKKEELLRLFNDDQQFGFEFYVRLLWLTGNQLHVSHMRQVSFKLNHNRLSIHNLVESNRSKLKLSSKLHQIPHLLNDRNTLKLGYELLHELNKKGDRNERHLASLCLDLTKSGEQELQFLEGLNRIYEVVAEDGISRTQEETRTACSLAVKNLFSSLNYKIDGWENLPDNSGNIFIYNHLLNDPYYTLANNFQITLDSHFISSIILNEKYGDPGMRIVRIGKGAEYAHQDYYHNLGHINVYTKDSDKTDEASKNQTRNVFFQEAGDHLSKAQNLIISPEGISYSTEESPGPFKSGAFDLALRQKDEPLIVPIVLCYFDRRITNNIFYCRIMKPFKVSDFLNGSKDRPAIKKFIKSYQKSFSKEVKKSIKIADKLTQRELT